MTESNRFWELAADITEIIEDFNVEGLGGRGIKQRVERLEAMVTALLWLHAQTLKALAERDGVDVSNVPYKITVVGETN